MIRIWVKDRNNRIQVSCDSKLHTANYSNDGELFDIKGDHYLLQACFEEWNPPDDKFQMTLEELKQKSDWLN